MNFIGHAYVALWSSDAPRFVLGSMLPDFAAMAGARLSPEPAATQELAGGIALHHRTDEVFHACTPFVALTQHTMDALLDEGVARGPARAVGHIGVEMLIDGELVHEPEVQRAYQHAIAAADDLEPTLFRDNGHTRFRAVHQRLRTYGVPFDYRDVDSVTFRLERVLARRPRLALDASARTAARTVLTDVQRRVVARLPELLQGLRVRLAPTARL